MNIGVHQTGDTCWFNSSINMFLTSDNGLKILWNKLQEIYPKLGPKQRAYFNSNINAPCPYKGILRVSRLYFWKFLNQYICAIGGPGRLIPKSGLNAYLTKNIKWRTSSTRESKGTAGAWPARELPTILAHLGFSVGKDFRMLDWAMWRYKFKKPEWTNPIMIFRNRASLLRIPFDRDLLLEKKGYELTGAIVYVSPARNSNKGAHVWSCSIRNGKGYVMDSNDPTRPTECDWWIIENLKNFFNSYDANYRQNRAAVMAFEVIMYTRKEFTNKIAPTCQLPKGGYRPLTLANQEKLKEFNRNVGLSYVNFLKTGLVGEAHRQFTPRVLAEVIRRNANRPLMTANVFNKFVKEAGSFNHGLRLLQHAKNNQGRKYKINENGQNFKNYKKKLIAKFPPIPVPKSMFMYFWQNSKTNTEFANRLRNYANRAGYTVNENKIKGILAMRAKTRAGTKRAEERIYKAGNNWYNNQGNNVTNKINTSYWVLNETPDRETERALAWLKNYNGNVTTYRRK